MGQPSLLLEIDHARPRSDDCPHNQEDLPELRDRIPQPISQSAPPRRSRDALFVQPIEISSDSLGIGESIRKHFRRECRVDEVNWQGCVAYDNSESLEGYIVPFDTEVSESNQGHIRIDDNLWVVRLNRREEETCERVVVGIRGDNIDTKVEPQSMIQREVRSGTRRQGVSPKVIPTQEVVNILFGLGRLNPRSLLGNRYSREVRKSNEGDERHAEPDSNSPHLQPVNRHKKYAYLQLSYQNPPRPYYA